MFIGFSAVFYIFLIISVGLAAVFISAYLSLESDHEERANGDLSKVDNCDLANDSSTYSHIHNGGVFNKGVVEIDTHAEINPATGLPMAGGSTCGLDVGGNPYGSNNDLH